MKWFNILFGSMITACALTECVNANVVAYTDFGAWQDAVGDFTTIDFTGHDQFTVITDQYIDLGVSFADGNDFISNTGSYPNDGSGLFGSWADEIITMEFSAPQLWIGLDHPGTAGIDLYSGDDLVASETFIQSGPGNFSGILSSTPFDKAIMWRPTNSAALIDDLHFGIPTPGAIAVLALAGVLGTGSRRRRG